MTAAIASHCVLQKSADAFWNFHDAVYDNQDLITPENAYAKLAELAAKAGTEAADVLRKRATESLDELRDMAKQQAQR